MFRRYAEEQRNTHLTEIARVDDPRGPAGLGRQSPVVELLQEDAAREHGRRRLVWTLTDDSVPGIDYIRFYQITSQDGGQVCQEAEAERYSANH